MPSPFPMSVLSSSLRCPRRRPAFARLATLMLAALWLAVAAPTRADTVPVKAAELRIEEGEVLLNAEFEFSLNPTLEEALEKGIPLYFVIDFELTRGRWYWLDEKVARNEFVYRVSYNQLTRQYRVASGLLTQTFNSLQEVERFIGRITSRPVAASDALAKGAKYEAVPGQCAGFARMDAGLRLAPMEFHAMSPVSVGVVT